MPWGSGRTVQPHGHGVLFYGGDQELAAGVGGYLGEGLAAGHTALVVATPEHRRGFAPVLTGAGVDVAAEQASGRLIMLDAATMLRGFMRGGRLIRARFESVVGDLLAKMTAAGQQVRIYAEMVAVLWDAGQVALALELEELWNALSTRLPFALLCGYPDRLLTDVAAAGDVHRVRGLHISVTGADPPPGAAERSFPQSPQAVREARRFVCGVLVPRGDEMLAADAELAAAELAANAVVHAHSGFTVSVAPARAGVCIAVRDGAPLPAGSGNALVAREGHGLGVVAQIADRLAVYPAPGGKVVWAEFSS